MQTMAAAEKLFLEAYDRLAPKLLRHCLLRVKTLQDAQNLTSQIHQYLGLFIKWQEHR